MISKDGEGQFGVFQRIVAVPAAEWPILIMLDQMVIRVARESERVEPEGVDGGQLQQRKTGTLRSQVGQVKANEVVTQHEGGAAGEGVELIQGLAQIVRGAPPVQ